MTAAEQLPEGSDSTEAAAPPPAEIPREISPTVRRRTWTEPRVRLWWLLAVGLLFLTLYVATSQAAAWWSERKLLTQGVAVQAVVLHATDDMNDITLPDKAMPGNSICELEFDWHGQKHRVNDRLPEHMERGEKIITGPNHPITIHVDKDDPDRWTDRTSNPPFASRQLIGVAIGLPIVALLAVLALLKRGKLANAWRNGPASPAIVVGKGQTPVAPRSRVLRCTHADSNDKRVFVVYLPAGAAAVEPGDVVWVITPLGKTAPHYAAAWFEREPQPAQP